MIQFKRGSTKNWASNKKPLAAGQPGYDKDRKKLKIGDGEHTWNELPDVSGLSRDDIIAPESEAKKKNNSVFGRLLNSLGINDSPIFTYGTEAPDKNTVGEVYLQCYDAEPEVDYVVETGVDGIWFYRKWHSGRAECYGTLKVTADLQTAFEGAALYYNSSAIKNVQYPITFKKAPIELASLQSPSGIVWLAGKSTNSTSKSAAYSLISPDKLSSVTYCVALNVIGYWK